MEDPFAKYLLLLPLAYNDGRPVPESVVSGFLDRLYVRFGGFTVHGTVKGAYRMHDGTRQDDESLVVWVAVRDEDVPDLREMVAEFGATLDQELMYMERTGGTVEFIPPKPPEDQSDE